MIALLAAPDISENKSKGKPIPNPKNIKLSKFEIKSEPAAVRVNNAAINNGLQGITIAPKKNP